MTESARNQTLGIKFSSLILIVMFLGFLNFDLRTSSDLTSGLITSSIMHRLLSVFLVGLFLIGKLRTIKYITLSNRLIFVFCIYLIYKLLTSIWSVNSLWTIYRTFEYAVIFLFMAYIALRSNEYEGIEYLFKALGIYYLALIFSVVAGSIVFTEDALLDAGGIIPKISGVLPILSSTTIANLSLILILLSLHDYFTKASSVKVLIILVASVTFIFAQSRTGAIVGLSYFLIFLLRGKPNLFHISLLILFSLIWFANSSTTNELAYSYLQRGQSIEELSSLSSRMNMWLESLNFFANSDLLAKFGGIGSFAGVRFFLAERNFIYTDQGASLFSTDNLFLEVLIDEGLIGLFFVSIIFFVTTKYIFKINKKPLLLLCLSLWAGLVISSITVANMFLHTNVIFILVFLTACKSWELNKIRTR